MVKIFNGHIFAFVFKRILERQFYRSWLGFLWIFLRVGYTAVLYFILFGLIFGGQPAPIPYVDYMFSGLLVWGFALGSITWGVRSIDLLRGVRQKIFLNEWMIVIAGMSAGSVAGIPWLFIVLLNGLFFSTIPFNINFFILISMINLCLFIISMTFIFSVLDVLGRDSRYLLSLLSGAMMFCTPIFYSNNSLPLFIQEVVALNPLTTVLHQFRFGLYGAQFFPEPLDIINVSILFMFILSILIFKMMVKIIRDLI